MVKIRQLKTTLKRLNITEFWHYRNGQIDCYITTVKDGLQQSFAVPGVFNEKMFVFNDNTVKMSAYVNKWDGWYVKHVKSSIELAEQTLEVLMKAETEQDLINDGWEYSEDCKKIDYKTW